MQNIFLNLKSSTVFRREALQRILGIDPEAEQSNPVLDNFFQKEEQSAIDRANLILKLTGSYSQVQTKDKLYAVLVFFVSQLDHKQALPILEAVSKSQQPILSRVKFFSLLYKSVVQQNLKKDLLLRSISLMEQQKRVSIFSSFIENFPQLMQTLTWQQNEQAPIYLRIINYIEQHAVYKKLWRKYIAEGLKSAQIGQSSPALDQLFIKLFSSSQVPADTMVLLHHPALINNKFYPFLEALLLGSHEAFSALDSSLLTNNGIILKDFGRRVKIQAIPQIFGGIKHASYLQVAQILKVQKDQVESYIIEAIHQGLLKAKIDEFHESIIVKEVVLRTLKNQQQAALQKSLTGLAQKLERLAQ